MELRVAVLGATGLVGREMLRLLEERRFPAGEVRLLASARSRGARIPFRGRALEVVEARPESFEGVDLVLSSAGRETSLALVPEAVARGALVVDNTSAFRLDPDVPLVVPEVNADRLADAQRRRIVANPNCSTIQLVLALAPLHAAAGVRRAVVATYQSASGAGARALDELERGTRADLAGEPPAAEHFPRPLAFDCLPRIDALGEDGDSGEERKLALETPRILEADVVVDALCVRVPVRVGHGEAVWLETEQPLAPEDARALLARAPGVRVVDDAAADRWPTPREAAGGDEVLVGRIHRARAFGEHGLSLWIAADNLRKGAALNAVQIAEAFARKWVRTE